MPGVGGANCNESQLGGGESVAPTEGVVIQ
jgi:hypothetical protein